MLSIPLSALAKVLLPAMPFLNRMGYVFLLSVALIVVEAFVEGPLLDLLDMVDLMPRMKGWLDTTAQTMGNWGSKEKIGERLSGTTVDPAPVIGPDRLTQLDALLREKGDLVAIGFDVLQAPRSRIVFEQK